MLKWCCVKSHCTCLAAIQHMHLYLVMNIAYLKIIFVYIAYIYVNVTSRMWDTAGYVYTAVYIPVPLLFYHILLASLKRKSFEQ